MQLWLNGEFLRADNAFLSIADRGFLLGDGVFETLRVKRGVPSLFDLHWARFEASAAHYQLPLAYSHEAICAVVGKLCQNNELEDCVARITLSRGAGGRGLRFEAEQKGTLLVTLSPLPPPSMGMMSLMIAPEPRSTGGSEWAHKALHCTPNAALMHRANLAGYDDALWLNSGGFILETCVANIFFVRDRVLYTPIADGSILPGIMRARVIHHAQKMVRAMRECDCSLQMLENADEIFCTNAVRRVIPVGKVNSQMFGEAPGAVTREIFTAL
jgi:branched-chain amino acid aminotransferase